MWRAAQKGALPRPDLTNLDVYLEVGSDVDHDALEVQALPDYRAFWQERLRRRHDHRPIARDDRFVTADVLGAWG